MQSIEILTHELGRFASMGVAGILAAAGAINTAVADAPTAEPVAAVPAIATLGETVDLGALPVETHVTFNAPVPGYAVNSNYGMRQLPDEHAPRLHAGVDIAAPMGSPVQAAASGVVIQTGFSPTYGNFVEIDHGKGVTTFYAHLQRAASGLRRGTTMATGQVLGYVGSTGRSTGPHLHFELRKNEVRYDPTRIIGRTFDGVSDIPLRHGATSAAAPRRTHRVAASGRVSSRIG